MPKTFSFTILLLLCYCTTAKSQEAFVHWQPLVITDSSRIWYDSSVLDTVTGGKFDIWVLQMHKPPLSFNEIPGKIYRSKTYYGLNLENGKYEILKVEYFGINNKKLYSFDYKTKDYPDNMRYAYPIGDNSTLSMLIKKLNKIHGDNKDANSGKQN